MTTHLTGTRKDWLAARLELLKAEKELTHRSDAVARQRQELPWVRIDKDYSFETDNGSASLKDLFRGRSQLLIYHFMFGPDYKAGCPSCSAIADGFNGIAAHLANQTRCCGRSRAHHEAAGVQAAHGLDLPWASSFAGDFNPDFNVWFSEQQQRDGGIEQLSARAAAAATDRRQQAGDLPRVRHPMGPRRCRDERTDVATYTRERPGMSGFVLEDGVIYHTYPPMPVDWTLGRTSGSTAHPRDATRKASGGATTTNTTSIEPPRVSLAQPGDGRSQGMVSGASFPAASSACRRCLCRQRDGDDRVVRIHVDDGRNGDARRLDDVDGVDADARTDMAGRGGGVPRHVARDDGSDDAAIPGADAVALLEGGRRNGRDAGWPADDTGGRRILPGVDRIRNGRLSARRCAGGGCDGGTIGRARRSDCGRRGHRGRRRSPVHRMEGTSPCLLPADAGARRMLPADAGAAWRYGLSPASTAAAAATADGGPARGRGHGPARWRSWRWPLPSNVSPRPARVSCGPSEPCSSGRDCSWSRSS